MSLCSSAKATRLKCQHEMSSGLASQSLGSFCSFLFNYWCEQEANEVTMERDRRVLMKCVVGGEPE